MKGRSFNLSRSYSGAVTLSVEVDPESVPQARTLYDELHDGDIDITVKRWRNKRSLDANAYCWALIGKLAAVLHRRPEEVYREYIPDVGDNHDVVCVPEASVKRLCETWTRNGTGWVTKTGPSKVRGCMNVWLYYGSSTYDTAQMSRLIDMVVDDCKAQGIETMTPRELAMMKEAWGNGT